MKWKLLLGLLEFRESFFTEKSMQVHEVCSIFLWPKVVRAQFCREFRPKWAPI